jgi:hypothetical protein
MLLQWAEDEARRLSQQAPAEVRCVLQVNIFETEQATIQLFEAEGFGKVRTWAHYDIHFQDAPPVLNPPEGMTIRSFDLDNDTDWDLVGPVQDAAFMDHWGAYSLPPVENAEPEESNDNDEEEPVLDFPIQTRKVIVSSRSSARKWRVGFCATPNWSSSRTRDGSVACSRIQNSAGMALAGI